jgi:hypothetical protein
MIATWSANCDDRARHANGALPAPIALPALREKAPAPERKSGTQSAARFEGALPVLQGGRFGAARAQNPQKRERSQIEPGLCGPPQRLIQLCTAATPFTTDTVSSYTPTPQKAEAPPQMEPRKSRREATRDRSHLRTP